MLLISFAVRWMVDLPGSSLLVVSVVGAGIMLGAAIALFGFRRIARHNINRIQAMPKRSCIFAFQKWQNYILIAFMMSLGLFIRRTHILSPIYMSIMYMGIGCALLSTSVLYYKSVLSKAAVK
ncbi:MAG: hypothetical protein PHP95_09270 [Desulfuromonadaceae bacterium]|nr:hypothetical protein [Desulfuromonadaceae bacterium]MDD2848634.1 hypothetical protein [Desulfuromonadaceae bacterium]MDD4130863.1 hypothetical protein [Desulfuromonadaceae bacterium]